MSGSHSGQSGESLIECQNYESDSSFSVVKAINIKELPSA